MNHPAKFSDPIMDVIGTYVNPTWRILDPFAGTGRVHELGEHTVGVELEPEWALLHPRTLVGNATHLPFAGEWFDAIVTSPCYGNRMADKHNAKDDTRRITYKHTLGRDLHPDNAGGMQWGCAYRALHREAWDECVRVLRPGGTFVLNISDHYRADTRQRVTAWHVGALLERELDLLAVERVPTQRMRFGANRSKRCDYESVVVFTKAEEKE